MTEQRLIDANARIEEIRKAYCTNCDNYNGVRCRSCWVDDGIGFLEDAPTIEAEPVVHAYWIKEQDEYGIDRGWKCSNCRCSVYEMTYEPYEGCPHCRAKMDGGNEDGC